MAQRSRPVDSRAYRPRRRRRTNPIPYLWAALLIGAIAWAISVTLLQAQIRQLEARDRCIEQSWKRGAWSCP